MTKICLERRRSADQWGHKVHEDSLDVVPALSCLLTLATDSPGKSCLLLVVLLGIIGAIWQILSFALLRWIKVTRSFHGGRAACLRGDRKAITRSVSLLGLLGAGLLGFFDLWAPSVSRN